MPTLREEIMNIEGLEIKHHRLSEEFTKWAMFFGQGTDSYFHGCLHHFTGKDKGDPHSHPHSFVSFVGAGGYLEREYFINKDGTYRTFIHERRPFSVFPVFADTIHEIIDLPEGEAWTFIVPTSAHCSPWHHWRFDETGIYRRLPDERDFTKLKAEDIQRILNLSK